MSLSSADRLTKFLEHTWMKIHATKYMIIFLCNHNAYKAKIKKCQKILVAYLSLFLVPCLAPLLLHPLPTFPSCPWINILKTISESFGSGQQCQWNHLQNIHSSLYTCNSPFKTEAYESNKIWILFKSLSWFKKVMEANVRKMVDVLKFNSMQ